MQLRQPYRRLSLRKKRSLHPVLNLAAMFKRRRRISSLLAEQQWTSRWMSDYV